MKTFSLSPETEPREAKEPKAIRPFIPHIDMPQNDYHVGLGLKALRQLEKKLEKVVAQRKLYMSQFDHQEALVNERIDRIRAFLQDYASEHRRKTGEASVNIPEGRVTYSEPRRLKVDWDAGEVLTFARKYNAVKDTPVIDKNAVRKILGDLDSLPSFAFRETSTQVSISIDDSLVDAVQFEVDDDLPF